MRKPLLTLSVISVFFAQGVIEQIGLPNDSPNVIHMPFFVHQNDVAKDQKYPTADSKTHQITVPLFTETGDAHHIIAKKASTAYLKTLASPNIIVGEVSGVISACVGSPSTSMQQFTVSGNNLTDNITVTAPAGFEISANLAGGFSNTFFFVTVGSTVTTKTVYVRAIAGGAPADLSGNITLTSAGAVTKKVAVKGTIYAPPTVDPITDITVANGDVTTAVNFTGTGNTFYWTNDKPAIGLAASGQDNIPSFTAVNQGSNPLVAHVSVTSQAANVAYIPDYSSNTVLVLNTITNKIIKTIPVGANPGLVAISPDGKKVYVGDVGGTALSIINTQTYQVKDIAIFDSPTGLIFSKDGTRAYVAGASGECTVIDVANDAVLTALTFFSGGSGIALSNDGKWIYATNYAMNDIRVYDTSSNAEIINIPAPGSHYAVTSADGKKIYAAGGASNCIWVIDVATNTMLTPINLNSDANILALSPDGSRIYVTNLSAGTVTIVNPANGATITTLPVGQSPEGISFTPDGKYVYVVNVDSATISIIDTSNYTVTATIPCGGYPRAVGNFISPGANSCPGNPTNFKITVNPSPTTITPGTVGGLITTCIGAPSTSLQQFTVSGNNLSGNITATAPAGFEISFSQTTGFADVLNIPPASGAVANKVIYVRAKASGTPAKLLGDVILSTPGAANKNVTVKGVVNDLPTTDAANNPVYNNGDITTEIKFTGTANTYTWVNDKPSIGLAASGTGDIPSFSATNTGVPPVVANITVTPSSDGYLYLSGSNNMILVDVDNNKQAATINNVGQTVGTAVSPDGSLVAVTDAGANTVKFINTTTHKVVSTVNNITFPIGICFSPDGKKVYVANETSFNVTVIDVATATAEPPFHVGVYPYGIAASPDGNTVYVGCTGENAIIAIDTKTRQITQIKVNFGPTGIAVSPDNSRVYATSAQNNGLLKVIDAASKTVIANIPIGSVSTGICVSPDGKRVYVSNTESNSVMVVDAELNKVIATIPTGNHPFGISITPDGKYVYVVNDGTNTVNVISTATNTITKNITVSGQLSKSFGNFFVPGTGCTGTPTKFTITVNGVASVTATAATGTISACAGTASINTQQFTVSGSNLTADISVTAPARFEVSLNETSGFASTVTIPQTGGTVTGQVIYVRSSVSGPAGNISGDVVLASAGVADRKVTVNGAIKPLPTVNKVNDQFFYNGEATTIINFLGTATSFAWTNDNPAIGLSTGGNGNIPSFNAVNNGLSPIIANITITPSDASCTGDISTFKITINPSPPTLTVSAVSGKIAACRGSASVNPSIQQFSVSGENLTGDIQVNPPANFDLSLNPNTGYSASLTLTRAGGNISNTNIYIRSTATATLGNISGNVVLSTPGAADQNVPVSGEVKAIPTANGTAAQAANNGDHTTPVHFTGTASAYSWTNDNPVIGLAASGTGDIPSFIAVNNSQSLITATITVVPSNDLCSGDPISFNFNIYPAPPSITTGAISGNIITCVGSPSASPYIQQFTVGGANLLGNIEVKAPANFEISLSPAAGYTDMVTLTPTTGKVNGKIIFIRSAVSAPTGSISGIVSVSSAGMPDQTVAVSGIVNSIPTIGKLSSLIYNNGALTDAINLGPSSINYTWTNNIPAIGLPSGGVGNIPSFTAVNNTSAPIMATITVVPSNGFCEGSPTSFQITVDPPPVPAVTFTDNLLPPLNTVYGTSSVLGDFSVSGGNLLSGIVITPPPGFEISSDRVNFTNTITAGTTGTFLAKTFYIRLAKTTPVGSYAGNITLSTTNATTISFPVPKSMVTPAPVIVKADNKTRPIKQENPTLTITYSGLMNNETEAVLSTKPQLQTEATLSSAAGNYAINFIGEAKAGNYSFTYVPGILTVTPVGVVIYNTFTPNGDGTNDTWVIKNIENYPKCTVNVFNRWGARVFSSLGYGQQWTGHLGGNPLPVGTYYYVIDLSDGSPVKAGWVAILR